MTHPDPELPASRPEAHASAKQARELRYWQRSRRLSFALLLVWGVVTFGGSFFARELSFNFFGWPFSFWLAAQGALLIYCVIVAFHAWAMRRLDEAAQTDAL